jgi:hypothetical protein
LPGNEFNNLSGRAIGDEVWRSAVLSTLAGEEGRAGFIIEALWDVSKAFDRVRHEVLARVCKQYGSAYGDFRAQLLLAEATHG